MSHRGPGSEPSQPGARAHGHAHAAPPAHGWKRAGVILAGCLAAVALLLGTIAGWRTLHDDDPQSQAAASAASSSGSAIPSAIEPSASEPSASVTSAAPSSTAAATASSASPRPTASKPSTTATKASAKPSVSRSSTHKASSTPSKSGPGRGDLDPHYASCKQVKAHGLGPYYRGNDPEYYWYADPDDDGINCD